MADLLSKIKALAAQPPGTSPARGREPGFYQPQNQPDQRKPDYRDDASNSDNADAEDPSIAAIDLDFARKQNLPLGFPAQPNSPNYKGMNGGAGGGTGAAFNVDQAVAVLSGSCGARPGGACLAHVENALAAGGFDLRHAGLRDRGGSHWAKDASAVFEAHTEKFTTVATGVGANFQSPDYKPQKGDVVVWEGGQYGHIAMCVGQRPDGSAIWQSDYTARAGNWTGLAHPEEMGTFHIFRQNAQEASVVPAPAQSQKAAAQTPQRTSAPSFHA